jgi:hypothetical protein
MYKPAFAAFALAAMFLSGLVQAQTTTRTTVRTHTSYSLVRCESFGPRQNFCPADTRGGIRLADDYSGRCRIGQTWGYTSRGIWVAGGCKADFSLSRGDNYGWGYGYTSERYIVCASEDFQRKFCPIGTSRGVKLVNQISNSACIRGRTWWRDARGIVVDRGCAGEFELNYRQADYETAPATGAGGLYRPETFVCASRGARRYCPADIGYGAVALVRTIGNGRCEYGRTWSYDREGVWVTQGCAAEFEVGYTDTAWVPEPTVRAIRCESVDYSRTMCDTAGARNVTLHRQLSRSACIEGRTWGRERGRVWVDDGCAADFILQ